MKIDLQLFMTFAQPRLEAYKKKSEEGDMGNAMGLFAARGFMRVPTPPGMPQAQSPAEKLRERAHLVFQKIEQKQQTGAVSVKCKIKDCPVEFVEIIKVFLEKHYKVKGAITDLSAPAPGVHDVDPFELLFLEGTQRLLKEDRLS